MFTVGSLCPIMSYVVLHSDMKDNYVLKSRYVVGYTIANTADEIISVLNERKIEGEKQVVATTSDWASSVIDLYYDSLTAFYHLPGCNKQGCLTTLMNKETMVSLALECGLKVPRSVVIDKKSELPSEIPYPCITKPIASIAGTKADIAVCRDEDELKDYLCRCNTAQIQVQKFIKKTMEYQLIGGKTGFLHYEHLDVTEPIRQCHDFLKDTGYNGLFSMEFIRDNDGNDYFMEINFRNDGNAICVTEAGVNLPYLWYLLCTQSTQVEHEKHILQKEVYVIPEFSEVNLWYTGKIGFFRMLREFKQADCGMEYAQDDPQPTRGRKDLYGLIVRDIIKKPIKNILKLIK